MKRKQIAQYIWLSVILLIMGATPGWGRAETVSYELSIAQETVTIAGVTTEGMTINGGIPGPTLRFREGDTARIHVHNRMSVATSIHWPGSWKISPRRWPCLTWTSCPWRSFCCCGG